MIRFYILIKEKKKKEKRKKKKKKKKEEEKRRNGFCKTIRLVLKVSVQNFLLREASSCVFRRLPALIMAPRPCVGPFWARHHTVMDKNISSPLQLRQLFFLINKL